MKRQLTACALIAIFSVACTKLDGLTLTTPSSEYSKNASKKEPSNAENPLVAETATLAPISFWNYLADSFTVEVPDDQERIQSHLTWLAKHPKYFERNLNKAQPFLFYIAKKIEEKKLPADLITLPIVESNYDPYAFSYAGAAGLWQLMPQTASRLGVTNNWWYDGRRDIQESTEAALDYLEFLNNEFDDWLLAVAAYNSGEGTVRRAIKNNQRRGLPTDFWHLALPPQTKRYVPLWLALNQSLQEYIESNPDNLPEIDHDMLLSSVVLDSQIDLHLVAELADISIEDVYRYNPGYNHWATAPAKSITGSSPQKILLPRAKADGFLSGLTEIPKEKRVAWQRYVIKPGDNLINIAKKHHTTVALLTNLNKLRSNHIIAGQKLLIPSTSHKQTTPLSKAPANKAHTKKLRSQQLRQVTYPVRHGDSLARIAKRFNVSINQISQWNPKMKKYIHPGQHLTLFVDVTRQFKKARV